MICFAGLLVSARASSQGHPATVPILKDKYSELVRNLEAGQTDIDYRAFRDSFVDSEQFRVAGTKSAELQSLRRSMHEAAAKSKHAEVVDAAKRILNIDYTDMWAHKALQQTYKALGDEAGRKKHHDIEFGLLNSIVKNGDGKSCKSAWPVIQVEEEYFILAMIGAKLRKQTMDPQGLCDKMEVAVEGDNRTYYFDIQKVMAGYKNLGIQ